MLLQIFPQYYNLSEHQSIDELMITSKGRSTLKQYMLQKPIKREYKIWEHADERGFVCQF